MGTTHLPETPLTWGKEDLDFIGKAMYLINKGYPVPTTDVMKLAEMIEKKERQNQPQNNSAISNTSFDKID